MDTNRILAALLPCLSHRKPHRHPSPVPYLSDGGAGIEKAALLHAHQLNSYKDDEGEDQYDEKHSAAAAAAEQIVHLLRTFPNKTDNASLRAKIDNIAHQQGGGWSEWLADRIRQGIEAVLLLLENEELERVMGPAMRDAYARACDAAEVFEGFVKEHPIATAVFVTVLAIGILVVLAPWVLEVLGFGELGPVEGEFFLLLLLLVLVFVLLLLLTFFWIDSGFFDL